MSYAAGTGATFVPGLDDGYYMPPQMPEVISPEPQRIQPEMSSQISHGIEAVQDLSLNAPQQRTSLDQDWQRFSDHSSREEEPHLSPFPKLVNRPPNVPPSDEELETTLENAREAVLNSNDPEMQLAWAADALVYAGVCADHEERIAAVKPNAARSVTPRIEHQLKLDAMSIVNFLADQHHPKADFLRGMWLEWGRLGQREDKREAFRCYSRAADKGYARAEYRIAMLHESFNDPIKALRHYNRGVDAGDAASCYRLGMMTLRGQCGQAQDFAKGIDLIRRSAEAADENAAQGAYVYGMLLCGEMPQITVPDQFLAKDERKARINIEKAAFLKFAKAQVKMGSAYELGSLGCDFNPALSVHYNALASKQGEAEADMALSKWFLVGSEGLFPKNEELAYTYAERAAQGGLATGEFALGYFNEIGMHVPVDLEKAMEWYRKASMHGNEDAKGRITGLENKQILSKKDHEKVAISRIKSQYGSRRGDRPERFQQQVSGGGLNGYERSQNGQLMPPRGTTPYPEDDGPPAIQHFRSPPSSSTPYPIEDGPPPARPAYGPSGSAYTTQQQLLRPASIANPYIRPSSAFQINPALQSNPSMSPDGRPYAAMQPPNLLMANQPYGGRNPDHRPRLDNRSASGPPAVRGYASQQNSSPALNQRPFGAPQQNPSPSLNQRPFPPSQPNSNATTSPRPPVDIGFSAPLDDRRARAYGPGRPAPNNSGGPPTKPSGPSPAPRPPAAESQKPLPQRPAAPATRPQETRKPVQTRPPPQTSVPPRNTSSVPNKVSAASNSSTNVNHKPASKAPKTFDEMGVPAQKQDGECVMM